MISTYICGQERSKCCPSCSVLEHGGCASALANTVAARFAYNSRNSSHVPRQLRCSTCYGSTTCHRSCTCSGRGYSSSRSLPWVSMGGDMFTEAGNGLRSGKIHCHVGRLARGQARPLLRDSMKLGGLSCVLRMLDPLNWRPMHGHQARGCQRLTRAGHGPASAELAGRRGRERG